MKWKHLFIGLSIIAAFILGAMFNPIVEIAAKTNNTPAAIEAVNAYTCPLSGEKMEKGRYSHSGTMHELIAAELDMTTEELHSARMEGKSIAELAEEKGIEKNALMDKLLEARKLELEQLLQANKITELQMNAMLEKMENNLEAALERKHTPTMNRHKGKMGMGPGYKNHQGMKKHPCLYEVK